MKQALLPTPGQNQKALLDGASRKRKSLLRTPNRRALIHTIPTTRSTAVQSAETFKCKSAGNEEMFCGNAATGDFTPGCLNQSNSHGAFNVQLTEIVFHGTDSEIQTWKERLAKRMIDCAMHFIKSCKNIQIKNGRDTQNNTNESQVSDITEATDYLIAEVTKENMNMEKKEFDKRKAESDIQETGPETKKIYKAIGIAIEATKNNVQYNNIVDSKPIEYDKKLKKEIELEDVIIIECDTETSEVKIEPSTVDKLEKQNEESTGDDENCMQLISDADSLLPTKGKTVEEVIMKLITNMTHKNKMITFKTLLQTKSTNDQIQMAAELIISMFVKDRIAVIQKVLNETKCHPLNQSELKHWEEIFSRKILIENKENVAQNESKVSKCDFIDLVPEDFMESISETDLVPVKVLTIFEENHDSKKNFKPENEDSVKTVKKSENGKRQLKVTSNKSTTGSTTSKRPLLPTPVPPQRSYSPIRPPLIREHPPRRIAPTKFPSQSERYEELSVDSNMVHVPSETKRAPLLGIAPLKNNTYREAPLEPNRSRSPYGLHQMPHEPRRSRSPYESHRVPFDPHRTPYESNQMPIDPHRLRSPNNSRRLQSESCKSQSPFEMHRVAPARSPSPFRNIEITLETRRSRSPFGHRYPIVRSPLPLERREIYETSRSSSPHDLSYENRRTRSPFDPFHQEINSLLSKNSNEEMHRSSRSSYDSQTASCYRNRGHESYNLPHDSPRFSPDRTSLPYQKSEPVPWQIGFRSRSQEPRKKPLIERTPDECPLPPILSNLPEYSSTMSRSYYAASSRTDIVSNTIYVSNLPANCSATDLMHKFSTVGQVTYSTLMGYGTAVLKYKLPSMAKDAVSLFDQSIFNNCIISVGFQHDK